MSVSYSGTFLGIIPFGVNVFTGPTPLVPSDKTYDTITLYGPGYIDKLHIQSVEVSQDIIDEYTLDMYAPSWGGSTILLANFEDTLAAGNVLVASGNPLVGWTITRRELGGSLAETICETDININSCIDATAQLGKTYIYDVYPITEEEVGEPLESDPITVDYYGYFLINPDDGVAYKFDLNAVSGSMTGDSGMTEYETFTERNAFSFIKKKIMRCSISAVVGTRDDNGEFSQPVETLEALANFIQNGKEKIFKTRKGQVFRGITTNYQQSVIDDNLAEQVYTVSFDFIESNDVLGS